MLASRRGKNRAQIRRTQLETHFAFKRKQLMEGNRGVVRQLHQQIMEYTPSQEQPVEIVKKIHQYIEEYPEDENSYILLGNLLVDHSVYFQGNFVNMLCDLPKYLENYTWCLSLMIYDLIKFLPTEDAAKKVEQDIKRLIGSMLWVVSTMRETLSRQPRRQSYEKEQKIWLNFMEALKISLSVLDDAKIVRKMVEAFTQISESFPATSADSVQELNEVVTRWQCCQTILQFHFLSLQQSQTMRNFLSILPVVAKLVITDVPQLRKQCLERMAMFSQQFGFISGAYIEFFRQSLFLFKEVPHLQELIIRLIGKNYLQQVPDEQFCFFLNSKYHCHLVQALRTAYDQRNQDLLFIVLGTISYVLNKVMDKWGQSTLDRVIKEMQTEGFIPFMDQLSQQNINQDTNHLISHIYGQFLPEDEEQIL